MAVGFLMQAIEALRPGRFRPRIWDWNGDDDDRPAGVRYYEDVIQQTAAEHWRAWQDVRLTQLNAEISVQVHSLSLKNHAKHAAIRRLYGGLRLMALVLGALMVVFAWLVWTQPEPTQAPAGEDDGEPSRRPPIAADTAVAAARCPGTQCRAAGRVPRARIGVVAARFRAPPPKRKGRYETL